MTDPALNHGSDCPSCGDHLDRIEPDGGVTQFAPFVRCDTCKAQYTLDGEQQAPPIPVHERSTSAGITMVTPTSRQNLKNGLQG